MLTIRLDPEVERRLAALAKRTGQTEAFHAQELIESNIEDLEDRYLAEERLNDPKPTVTSEQARKELGIDR